MLKGSSQELKTHGGAEENLGNNCHPLSLLSHIISNSNGNIKRVDDLREKEACVEGNLGSSRRKNPSLSKAFFNDGLRLFKGEPSASRAHSEEDPLHDLDLGPSFSEKQALLASLKDKSLCYNIGNSLKVSLPRYLSSSLHVSKPHVSPDRKLGSSCVRSLPPTPFLEKPPSSLDGSVVASAENCFQERELSSKAKIFLGRESQSLSLMERSRQSKARGSMEEAEGVSSPCLGDGPRGVKVRGGALHCR